jgi:hypothetical protein
VSTIATLQAQSRLVEERGIEHRAREIVCLSKRYGVGGTHVRSSKEKKKRLEEGLRYFMLGAHAKISKRTDFACQTHQTYCSYT